MGIAKAELTPDLSYLQGFKSRSGVEYSLLRKYYLFLLFSVLFIFMVATQWAELAAKLSKNPTKVGIVRTS